MRLNLGPVTRFVRSNYRHFNGASVVEAGEAYVRFVEMKGKMIVALGGAMSTAELGRSLAPMIRAHRVHAIVCTGANLEEDLFHLVARESYQPVPQYRHLTVEDEVELGRRNLNRITDTCIPDDVIWGRLEEPFLRLWTKAEQAGRSYFPHEYVYEILRSNALKRFYQIDPAHSWIHAAMLARLPVFVPGWEDSSLGNMFAGAILRGLLAGHTAVHCGIAIAIELKRWKAAASAPHGLGLLQIGGGIAGHFAAEGWKSRNRWGYWCRVGDSPESFGSWSGETPRAGIVIESDATIVAPLLFALALGH